MAGRPDACPGCGGAVLIRSGHARGRQRWRCKGCGRPFTRTTPRGKPAAMRREAVGLYCAGLSLSAIGRRLGVSARSVMRWIRGRTPGRIAPSRRRPGARAWSSSTRSGTSSKKVPQALDLEGARAPHGPADRLGLEAALPSGDRDQG
jgi:hypothetical protein